MLQTTIAADLNFAAKSWAAVFLAAKGSVEMSGSWGVLPPGSPPGAARARGVAWPPLFPRASDRATCSCLFRTYSITAPYRNL